MLSVLFEGVGYSEINLRLMKNNRYLYIKAPVWLFSIGLGLLASTGAFGVEIMKPEQATTEIRDVDGADYKPRPEHRTIYGTGEGPHFYLHYCLPGFVPKGVGDCASGIRGTLADNVQVEFRYSLNEEDHRNVLLEGFSSLVVPPFEVNKDLQAKTPLYRFYREVERLNEDRNLKVIEHQGEEKSLYDGLIPYDVERLSMIRFWVPNDHDTYVTVLGNPPIFYCVSRLCSITMDQRNGWSVKAYFNEEVLKNWQGFLADFDRSIMDVKQ